MSNEQSNTTSNSFSNVPREDANRLRAAAKHASVRRESQRNGAPRERDEDLGGLTLQMSVAGDIPGYHLYWENDENAAIDKLLREGFDFVTREELLDRKPRIVSDVDISSVGSRYVKGSRTDGTPLRAYLLKCPDEVWSDRERARYRQADAWDASIRAGTLQGSDGRYRPK